MSMIKAATYTMLPLACMSQAVSAQTATSPHEAPMEFVTELQDCSGLPCVQATLPDGQHLRLAIDTGNPTSLLTAKAVTAHDIDGQSIIGPNGQPVGGYQKALIPVLKVGSGSLNNTKFVIGDLSSSIAKGTFPNVDGTIAYGALLDRAVQLDYREHKLRYSSVLSEASPCPAGHCGTIRLVTFGRKGPPVVVTDGFSVNGHPMSVQVDTMYAGSLLVYPAAVDKLNLKSLSNSTATRYFPFTDEGVSMVEARGRHGSIRQSNPGCINEFR